MDPITSVCNAIVAVCALWEKIIDGQTPDQKARMWQQFLDAQDFWRGLVKPKDRTP